MKKFNPKLMAAIGQASVDCQEGYPELCGFAAALATCDAMSLMAMSPPDNSLTWGSPEGKLKAKTVFIELHKQIEEMGLRASAATAQKIVDVFDAPRISAKIITILSRDLCRRLKDEMNNCLFYSIDLDKQRFITDPNLFGNEVANSFPSAIVDIEEAGKCLAFERSTACVFHLMRVMEVGLHVLEHTLKLPSTANQNWEHILKKCDSELAKPLAQRLPEWASDDAFFSGATAMLRSVKDAWRNPTMHIEKVYTEAQAQDIWNAVKGFMRLLATKLKETP